MRLASSPVRVKETWPRSRSRERSQERSPRFGAVPDFESVNMTATMLPIAVNTNGRVNWNAAHAVRV